MALHAPLATETATEPPLDAQTAERPILNEASLPQAAEVVQQPGPSATAPGQLAAPTAPDTAPSPNEISAPSPTKNTDAEGSKEASPAASEQQVPSQLDVTCAETQATLKLDFKQMRCVILYRGE